MSGDGEPMETAKKSHYPLDFDIGNTITICTRHHGELRAVIVDSRVVFPQGQITVRLDLSAARPVVVGAP